MKNIEKQELIHEVKRCKHLGYTKAESILLLIALDYKVPTIKKYWKVFCEGDKA